MFQYGYHSSDGQFALTNATWGVGYVSRPFLCQNNGWMLDNQSACFISITPLPTPDFTVSDQFRPLPISLLPSAAPSPNSLYVVLNAIEYH